MCDMCDMTHSRVQRDSSIRVTRLIFLPRLSEGATYRFNMWHVTYSYVRRVRHDSFMPASVRYDSLICVTYLVFLLRLSEGWLRETWLIHMRDMWRGGLGSISSQQPVFLTQNNFLSYPCYRPFARFSSICSTNVPYYCSFLTHPWGLPTLRRSDLK